MGFWDSISRFAGNLTGGLIGESDEERRRKQQQQAQQKAATSRSVASFASVPQPGWNKPAPRVATSQPQAQSQPQPKPQPARTSFTAPLSRDSLRYQQMEKSLDAGKSFEDIANETGLGVEEIRQHVNVTRPNYGVKPLNLQTVMETGGKMIKQLGNDTVSIVKKPVATAQFVDPNGYRQQELRDLQAAYQRGDITNQRLFEETQKRTNNIIGKKTVRDDQGNVRIVDQNPLEFGQSFTDAGVNALNVAPVATSTKAAMQGGKVIKQALNEAKVWGTVDTANDAIQGRLSPESIAMNYAGNAAGSLVGGAAGKLAKDLRHAQSLPENEAGSIQLPGSEKNLADNIDYRPLGNNIIGDKTRVPLIDARRMLTKAGYQPHEVEAVIDSVRTSQKSKNFAVNRLDEAARKLGGVPSETKADLSTALGDKITPDDMKDIVATHRKRFGDSQVELNTKDVTNSVNGTYHYKTDMINLVQGKADIGTFHHESIHKAIGQFLDDSEIEGLYSDIVKLRGGKRKLQKEYQSRGYADATWRTAAEEEIANTFKDFVRYNGMPDLKKQDWESKAYFWAVRRGLSPSVAKTISKLAARIQDFYAGSHNRAIDNLEAFYRRVDNGEFNGAPRREGRYQQPVSPVTQLKDAAGNVLMAASKNPLVPSAAHEAGLRLKYGNEIVNSLDKNEIQGPLKPGEDARARFGQPRDLGDKTPPKFDNRPETLLARATEAGMNPETAIRLMKEHGANKFRIMLDDSGNLNGAKNPDALATHALKQIPDGNVKIGGTATNDTVISDLLAKRKDAMANGQSDYTYAYEQQLKDLGHDVNTPQDTPPIEAYDMPAPKTAPSVAEQVTADAAKAYKAEQKRWAQIDKQLEQMGHNPTEVRQKITAAARGEYQPTKSDLEAFQMVQGELDAARQDLAGNGVNFDGTIEHYRPEQAVGTVKTAADQYTREDFMNFGYANSRKYANDLENIDYSANPEIDYTFKARNRDLVLKSAIARAAEKDGRTVTKESVEQAAKDTIELQDTIKDHAAKSGKVIQHDTLGRLNQIGANEGYTLTTNTTRAGVMAQEPKNILERAGVYDSGFQQYVNADGYAAELMRMTDEAGSDVSATLPQAIGKAFPEGDASSIENIVGWAQWRLEKATTQEQKQAIVSATFRTAAKSELQRLGKTTIFADRKTAKVVNEQMNHILLNDAYQRNAAEKLDRFISHRINESLRGGNVLSALFEAGDFFNILSDFGGKNIGKSKIGFGKIDGDYYGMSKRYGKGDIHFLSPEMSKEAGKLDEIWSDPRTTVGQKLYRSAQNVRDKSLLFGYVEKWKTELFLRQADAFYRAKGLSGKKLVDTVNAHYDKTMLPSTALTINRLISKLPSSLTQYLAWGINSTKRLGRTIGGNNEFGKYADMSRTGRIARGVVTEIAPKVLTASVLGIPMTQILGGRDFTGMSSGDYSGINQEDKNAIDAAVNLAGISPAMGMLINYYNGYRVNEIAGLNGEAQSNWALSATGKNASMLIPYFSQAKKVADVVQGQQQGYFTSRDGRVTTEALPMGEAIQGAILGKNYTQTMRDYNDNPNIISVANGKASFVDLLTHNETVDNVNKALGGKTARDYTRPLNKQYSEEFKKAEQGARRELLKGGRQFNEYLDNLRQNHPDFYRDYLGTMDGDQVKPEFFKTIAPTKDGQVDLTIFKTMGDRKRQLKKDFGTPYNPMWDLEGDQAKQVLLYKSAPTGDNIALRNALNKEQWYKDFKAKQDAYFDANPKSEDGEGFKQTQRVKEWNALDTELGAYYYQKGDEKPAWADKYPLVYELKQYEFGSPESKAFFKANYDAWKAQSDAFDRDRLETINKMRKIEGYPPMSMDAYKQVNNVVDTEGDGKSSSSKESNKGDYDKNGNWRYYGRRGYSSGGSSTPDRTGVADTIDNLSSKNTGIKAPKINYGTMKNPTKVVKTKRAKGTSSIRINI